MVLVCLDCLPCPLDDEGLVRGSVLSPEPCSVPAASGAYEEYAKWMVPNQTQPTLCCVSPHSFFPLTLGIDHMTQSIVTVGQICVALDTSLQVFIHQT